MSCYFLNLYLVGSLVSTKSHSSNNAIISDALDFFTLNNSSISSLLKSKFVFM